MTGALHPRAALDAWLENTLDPAARAALEAHLAACPRCRAELAALRATRAALRLVREGGVPESREGAPGPREGAPGTHEGAPGAHEGAPGARDGAPGTHEGAPGTHERAPGARDGAPGTREADDDESFVARLRTALDGADAEDARVVDPVPPGPHARAQVPLASPPRRTLRTGRGAAWLAAAVLGLALLATWYFAPHRTPAPARADLAARAAAALEAIGRGEAPLESRVAQPAALEAYFAGRGLGFRARVLDLAMMGWTVEGGSVVDLGDRRAVVFTYTDAAGRRVLCTMFPGRIGELPAATEEARFERNGITFVVVRRAGETIVFWDEGAVLCALRGDLPRDELVALAVAKAMQPA